MTVENEADALARDVGCFVTGREHPRGLIERNRPLDAARWAPTTTNCPDVSDSRSSTAEPPIPAWQNSRTKSDRKPRGGTYSFSVCDQFVTSTPNVNGAGFTGNRVGADAVLAA
jgi:hypothetical protein